MVGRSTVSSRMIILWMSLSSQHLFFLRCPLSPASFRTSCRMYLSCFCRSSSTPFISHFVTPSLSLSRSSFKNNSKRIRVLTTIPTRLMPTVLRRPRDLSSSPQEVWTLSFFETKNLLRNTMVQREFTIKLNEWSYIKGPKHTSFSTTTRSYSMPSIKTSGVFHRYQELGKPRPQSPRIVVVSGCLFESLILLPPNDFIVNSSRLVRLEDLTSSKRRDCFR